MFSCSQDTQDKMTEVIKTHRLNRVVVAACTPKTHEPLFQETLMKDMVKLSLVFPIICNINSPKKAKSVLQLTGADAIMIGRAAQGKPWIFKQIRHYLKHDSSLIEPTISEIQHIVLCHLEKLYSFYGNSMGVRIARKHINWYFKNLGSIPKETKNNINQADLPELQTARVNAAFNRYKNNRAA